MYFHYWCRHVAVIKITHRAAAVRNAHGAVLGRCKHLFILCQYGTTFKLFLSAFRFGTGENYSSTSVVALLYDLSLKCSGAVCELQISPVHYCLYHVSRVDY